MYDNLIGIHYRGGVIAPQWMPDFKVMPIVLDFVANQYQKSGITYFGVSNQITLDTQMYFRRAEVYGITNTSQIYAFGSNGIELLFNQKYYRNGTFIREGY